MTLSEAIMIIKTEKACVERQGCDRECKNCDLVMDSADIIEAFDMATKYLAEANKLCRCEECVLAEPSSLKEHYVFCNLTSMSHPRTGFCMWGKRKNEVG